MDIIHSLIKKINISIFDLETETSKVYIKTNIFAVENRKLNKENQETSKDIIYGDNKQEENKEALSSFHNNMNENNIQKLSDNENTHNSIYNIPSDKNDKKKLFFPENNKKTFYEYINNNGVNTKIRNSNSKAKENKKTKGKETAKASNSHKTIVIRNENNKKINDKAISEYNNNENENFKETNDNKGNQKDPLIDVYEYFEYIKKFCVNLKVLLRVKMSKFNLRLSDNWKNIHKEMQVKVVDDLIDKNMLLGKENKKLSKENKELKIMMRKLYLKLNSYKKANRNKRSDGLYPHTNTDKDNNSNTNKVRLTMNRSTENIKIINQVKFGYSRNTNTTNPNNNNTTTTLYNDEKEKVGSFHLRDMDSINKVKFDVLNLNKNLINWEGNYEKTLNTNTRNTTTMTKNKKIIIDNLNFINNPIEIIDEYIPENEGTHNHNTSNNRLKRNGSLSKGAYISNNNNLSASNSYIAYSNSHQLPYNYFTKERIKINQDLYNKNPSIQKTSNNEKIAQLSNMIKSNRNSSNIDIKLKNTNSSLNKDQNYAKTNNNDSHMSNINSMSSINKKIAVLRNSKHFKSSLYSAMINSSNNKNKSISKTKNRRSSQTSKNKPMKYNITENTRNAFTIRTTYCNQLGSNALLDSQPYLNNNHSNSQLKEKSNTTNNSMIFTKNNNSNHNQRNNFNNMNKGRNVRSSLDKHITSQLSNDGNPYDIVTGTIIKTNFNNKSKIPNLDLINIMKKNNKCYQSNKSNHDDQKNTKDKIKNNDTSNLNTQKHTNANNSNKKNHQKIRENNNFDNYIWDSLKSISKEKDNADVIIDITRSKSLINEEREREKINKTELNIDNRKESIIDDTAYANFLINNKASTEFKDLIIDKSYHFTKKVNKYYYNINNNNDKDNT